MPHAPNWLDRAIGFVAPTAQLRRTRARIATDLVQRHYEAAAVGRRTAGWNRSSTDANTINNGSTLSLLRDTARDLVRNNGYADAALNQIGDEAVGWGIFAKSKDARAMERWKAWAESTDCDADGRDDIYGLQNIIIRGVAEAGEMLVRRRMRRVEDGFALPFQLQVMEPDMLDTAKTLALPNGGTIIQGVEFDALGARVAYWLFPVHPGSSLGMSGSFRSTLFAPSRRIDARDILHIFMKKRAGQVRAASWFANVLLKFKDFDEYEDATLMKAKIAACLAVITSDVDGSAAGLGTADDTTTPGVDLLEPGAIINVPPGRTVEVVQPPTTRDHESYTAVTLRGISAGLGVLYEGMTGDHTNLSFSAARMSRLSHQPRVDDRRWRLMIPQFCIPVWGWAMETAQIMGHVSGRPAVEWTTQPMPMINPSEEGLAYQRNIRTGIQTLSESIRERGFDPDELFAEMASDNKKLDALGLVLDSDPRRMSQAGQPQSAAVPAGDAGAARSDDAWQRLAGILRTLPKETAVDLIVALADAQKRAAGNGAHP